MLVLYIHDLRALQFKSCKPSHIALINLVVLAKILSQHWGSYTCKGSHVNYKAPSGIRIRLSCLLAKAASPRQLSNSPSFVELSLNFRFAKNTPGITGTLLNLFS